MPTLVLTVPHFHNLPQLARNVQFMFIIYNPSIALTVISVSVAPPRLLRYIFHPGVGNCFGSFITVYILTEIRRRNSLTVVSGDCLAFPFSARYSRLICVLLLWVWRSLPILCLVLVISARAPASVVWWTWYFTTSNLAVIIVMGSYIDILHQASTIFTSSSRNLH